MKLFALLFVLLAGSLAPAFAQGPPAALSGSWGGTLNAGGTTLSLVVHFAPKPDGTLTATIDQGGFNRAFDVAQITGQTVHLEASPIGASFDGTLDKSGKTIIGSWKQSGSLLPLTLTKMADQTSGADVHLPQITNGLPLSRPQEPHPPFPYTSTEVTFSGGAAGVTLAGTLTTPPGAGPFPAAVLISGSGPNNRDELILGHKPFLLLADTLTRRGVAVLRYDKRGVGQSTGSFALATTPDFAADTQAAVAYLKTQAALDSKRIGLIGHSEGGLIAPLVASEHPADIAFVVLLAGQGMTGEKILLAQAALIAKANGASEVDVAQETALQKQLFTLAESETDPASVQTKAQAAILAALTPKEKKEVGNPILFAKAQSGALASPWMRFFLTYDPTPALEKTRCPVLALNGSKDLQVPPAEDLAAIASALKAGGNTNVTIKELPSLNHLFQTCRTGSPSEYATITETMAPSALAIIGDWVAGQTGAK